MEHVGSCACGQLRLVARAEPSVVCLCHCASCRRAVGAGPVAWATFKRQQVALTGEVVWRRSSARAERGHCAACGTSMLFASEPAGDEVDVCVDVLSAASSLCPTHHIWVCERTSWTCLEDGLPRHVGDSHSPLRDPALVVRAEGPHDAQAIARVQSAAFGQPDEAHMVERLRAARALVLSLVAVRASEVVGHVAFSPVRVEGANGQLALTLGLAPVGVLPRHQRQGVGAQLIAEGLAQLRRAGHPAVFVLGDPAYYSRFGFECAAHHGLGWEHPAPIEAFMVQALQPDGLPAFPGTVRFRPELGE